MKKIVEIIEVIVSNDSEKDAMIKELLEIQDEPQIYLKNNDRLLSTDDDYLHPAMIELLTDLKYHGGYYAYDRISAINSLLKANSGNHLEQFKAVRDYIDGDAMESYTANLGFSRGKKGAKETFYGQEVDLEDEYRRDQIRVAYLNQIISHLEQGKEVVVSKGGEIIESSVDKSQAKKIIKLVTDGTISIDTLGKFLALYATTHPDLVIAVISEFGWLLEDDISEKISYYAKDKLSIFDTKLLTRMRDALDPDNNMISTPNEKKEWNRVKTALGKDLSEDKNIEKHYTVTNGDAWVRDEKGQELNTEGGIFKKGDKHKIIPKGTKVIATEEKDALVKVKSIDGKTIYGWTNKSNLTRIASVSEIKAWKDKKVTATKIADKNKEYAELILEAEELGITQFSETKVRQTFVKIKNLEKIGSGKHLGKLENWYSDPKTTEILILSTILSILKMEVDIWLAGDQKNKISNVKIGSFMIWGSYINEDGIDVSDELRDSNHGGKGRAIDLNIDGTNFTSDAAVEMVNRIISNLPKIDGTYEVGLPFQGQFFPKDQKGKTLKKYTTKTLSGSKIVLDYIKSEKLKKTIKDLQKKGYKFEIFPDNDNHLHLGVE